MSVLCRTTALVCLTLALMAADFPTLARLQKMSARFAPAELRVETRQLPAGDQKALLKLLQAARIVNDIYMEQLWGPNMATYNKVRKDGTALGRERMHYYWISKGPWSELDGHEAFLPGVPQHKPAGANFYPAGMTKEEFEDWVKTLSKQEQERAAGFFTVIRRSPQGKLAMTSYSAEYAANLQKAAAFLKEAAALTGNESLKKFLTLRAEAFLNDDYYVSDVAWMDIDAPLDITIGPYETYTDELFGYKAAFEAYITVRDDAETARLKFFSDHMQEIEDNLPIERKYKNPKIGALAPIRVVNEILSTGDAAHGVRSAAFNLPNDERVVREKGSKRVMLKNVQEAKFNLILKGVSQRVLAREALADVSFDAFFTHILAHEMTHGIGPMKSRRELKELYGAIEEAKADVCGLFMLQYLLDKGMLKDSRVNERNLYTTFLASSFRTLRFGLNEAHGKGMAVQVRYLLDKGAIGASAGTFSIVYDKVKTAVRDLARDLLNIEATGDYAAAKALIDRSSTLSPEFQKALDRLKDIPVDIEPQFVTATALARAGAPAPRPASSQRKAAAKRKR